VNPRRIYIASVGKQELERVMCAELRLKEKHTLGSSRMDGEHICLRECGPRDFQTKGPNEMARCGEERRLVVARSPLVDVVFPTWYRTTGKKPSAKLPIRRGCSDVLVGFHVLLISFGETIVGKVVHTLCDFQVSSRTRQEVIPSMIRTHV
jgi:hypothetical protein